MPLWVSSTPCTFTVMSALFGSLPTLCIPWGQGLGHAPWLKEVLDGIPRPTGEWLELDMTLTVGTAATSWASSPPQLGLEYSSVAKEEARRWKEGGRVFRNTRSIQISFSSVFPMLSPPSTVSTESSQEPGYSLLGRRTKLSRVTKGKRINIYQIPAMHRHCSKFLCTLYLTYTCTHLADEKTEDLRG